ncbi:wax ester/triacylglycerol synthase family O-acyltransferase [uncultured Mycobacterium sp.]|uniref:WS/DGAT/MGAT family O-acyltransferase n=1 Tax=uncultured Mycobacterium sp. TaxID=171292 RepID=UPI0035CBD911
MKRLNGWDALMLYSETPNVHQHTLKVAVIDISDFAGTPTVEVLRDMLRRRLHLLEPLRYQLIDVPLHLHRPMWRERVEVDLGYHVRPIAVPAPGGRRELDRVTGLIASTPLDRSRPLWEMYFAEGLAGPRVAVIAKIHHALADGVASANLMARALDWPQSSADERDRYDTDPEPSAAQLLAAAGRDHLRQLAMLPGAVRQSAMGIARLRRRAHERGPQPQMARAFHPPLTFINHKLSPRRTFATATLSLADVKQTAKRLEITINDLVLATAAGTLRELLLRYDGRADQPLIASVPVSIDTSPQRISGNALSTMLVSLPVQVDDALARVRLTCIATRIAKENHELLGRKTIASWIDYAPAFAIIGAFRWTSAHRQQNQVLNLKISNVPGPRERGRVAGAVVSEIYSVGPVAAGSGLNITVRSYADQLNISVLADDGTLTEPHESTDAMISSFAEIRCAAGLGEQLSRVGTAMPQASAI